MPNWCEGTLKIRGKIENVERWCKENLNVYSPKYKNCDFSYQLDNPIKINIYDEEMEVDVTEEAYIVHTRRNFVKEGSYYGSEHNGVMRLALEVKAAWAFENKPYIEMSKDYGVDFRLYGFDCGGEFNQEVIIEGGELIADDEITYDDYFWECPFPNLGG